jgi:hypothetical protein
LRTADPSAVSPVHRVCPSRHPRASRVDRTRRLHGHPGCRRSHLARRPAADPSRSRGSRRRRGAPAASHRPMGAEQLAADRHDPTLVPLARLPQVRPRDDWHLIANRTERVQSVRRSRLERWQGSDNRHYVNSATRPHSPSHANIVCGMTLTEIALARTLVLRQRCSAGPPIRSPGSRTTSHLRSICRQRRLGLAGPSPASRYSVPASMSSSRETS